MVARIFSKEKLKNAIQQEPLIVTAPSLEGTENIDLPIVSYFGVGLCSRHELSQAVPVDALGMILAGEMFSSEKSILVADSHAKTNGFDNSDIDRVARKEKETLERVCGNLGFSDWNIMLASEIDSTMEYLGIMDSIPEDNNYVVRELADMEWFRRRGVNIKIGWMLNGSRDSSETFFDQKFREHFSHDMSFLYLESGKTMNPKAPRAPPYFCGDVSSRIVLEPEENVSLKIEQAKEAFGNNGVNCCRNSMKRLVRMYDKIVEPTERGPIETRVQQIVDRCLG